MACCRQDWWRTFCPTTRCAVFLFQQSEPAVCDVSPIAWILPQTAEFVSRNACHRLQQIDRVVQRAIDDGDIPGAVVLVGRNDRVVFCRAYGQSRQLPTPAPMRTDLRFDLASLTKPVATATSVLLLIERGDLRLTDRVSDYVPNFSRIFLPDGSPGEEARIQHC
jgi:CubicO group peptidase (beta-lactamase class C family)